MLQPLGRLTGKEVAAPTLALLVLEVAAAPTLAAAVADTCLTASCQMEPMDPYSEEDLLSCDPTRHNYLGLVVCPQLLLPQLLVTLLLPILALFPQGHQNLIALRPHYVQHCCCVGSGQGLFLREGLLCDQEMETSLKLCQKPEYSSENVTVTK